ncbi:MAG: hypothetical protein ACLFVV_29260, partial [Coleofasciculus sp.]
MGTGAGNRRDGEAEEDEGDGEALTFHGIWKTSLENLSPNLSLALSYKEREAEYIFLFGEALNSPPSVQKKAKHPLASPWNQKLPHPLASPCKKSEATSGFPHETKSEASLVLPPATKAKHPLSSPL